MNTAAQFQQRVMRKKDVPKVGDKSAIPQLHSGDAGHFPMLRFEAKATSAEGGIRWDHAVLVVSAFHDPRGPPGSAQVAVYDSNSPSRFSTLYCNSEAKCTYKHGYFIIDDIKVGLYADPDTTQTLVKASGNSARAKITPLEGNR